MQNYHDLLKKILAEGVADEDRTGVGTLSIFGYQLRFDLSENFHAITTKKLAWKPVVSELLWFIEGSRDERRLAEIQYGKPRSELVDKTTIWTENAQADYWKDSAEFDGDLGPGVYGAMWRRWPQSYEPLVAATLEPGIARQFSISPADARWPIDQLAVVINGLKTNPNGRRHIITAWNPAMLDKVALPPCHMMMQFYVRNNELSCMMTQRSCDVPLGLPFNIASYSLLTAMIARECNFKTKELIINLGDAHIYKNQIPGVEEQLPRTEFPEPKLWLNPEISRVVDFKMSDVKLLEYQSHPTISFPFAV